MPAISQPMLDKLAEYQILRQGSEAEAISDIHQDQHNIQKFATDGVFVFVFVFVFVGRSGCRAPPERLFH